MSDCSHTISREEAQRLLAADCIAVDAAKIADAALAEEARTRGQK